MSLCSSPQVLNILVACVAVLDMIDGHYFKDWNYSFGEQNSLAMDPLPQNASADKLGANGFGVYRRIKRSALLAFSKSVYSFEVREDTAPGEYSSRKKALISLPLIVCPQFF